MEIQHFFAWFRGNQRKSHGSSHQIWGFPVFSLGLGEINGKAMVLPTKSGVFRCRFSLKSIQRIFPWTFFSIFPSGNPERSAPAPAEIAVAFKKGPGQLQVIALGLIFVYYMDIQYIYIYIYLQTMIMIICTVYIYIYTHIILYIYIIWIYLYISI